MSREIAGSDAELFSSGEAKKTLDALALAVKELQRGNDPSQLLKENPLAAKMLELLRNNLLSPDANREPKVADVKEKKEPEKFPQELSEAWNMLDQDNFKQDLENNFIPSVKKQGWDCEPAIGSMYLVLLRRDSTTAFLLPYLGKRSNLYKSELFDCEGTGRAVTQCIMPAELSCQEGRTMDKSIKMLDSVSIEAVFNVVKKGKIRST